MIKDTYNLAEAAHYAGFKTPWMVDYLCKHEIIFPTKRPGSGHGRPRLFSFSDLVVLRAVRELLAKGISVKKLTSEFKKNKKNFKLITENVNPFRYLITDGTNLYLKDQNDGVQMLSKPDQYCFHFIVDMDYAHTRVRDTMAEGLEVKSVKSFRKGQTQQQFRSTGTFRRPKSKS